MTGTKELAGATKLLVEEGIPVGDVCAFKVTNADVEGLVVGDAWMNSGVGTVVADVDVEEALGVGSASSQSNSSFSSWAIGSPEAMVTAMARRAQRCVVFVGYMITSPV